MADPRAVAEHWPDPRLRALADLALQVTVAPWELSRGHLFRAQAAGLTDDEVLHAIALAAYFGHLNRIADAVDIPLDYEVRHAPPAPDRAAPAFEASPVPRAGRQLIELARRPATATALAAWRKYSFERDAPLTRRQRTVIARWVAEWLGDGGISSPRDLTANPLDEALRCLAEIVTLAPWRLDEAAFVPLREAGFNDAELFDVCATASSAGVFSRIEVALISLAS